MSGIGSSVFRFGQELDRCCDSLQGMALEEDRLAFSIRIQGVVRNYSQIESTRAFRERAIAALDSPSLHESLRSVQSVAREAMGLPDEEDFDDANMGNQSGYIADTETDEQDIRRHDDLSVSDEERGPPQPSMGCYRVHALSPREIQRMLYPS